MSLGAFRGRITNFAKGLGVCWRRDTIFFYLGWPEGIVSISVGQPDPTRPNPTNIPNANPDPSTPADRMVPINGWRLVEVPRGLVLCASLVRFVWFCVSTQHYKK